jgi:hypothetical protein
MAERLDVRRMLLRRGWTEDPGLGKLRKNGALWAVTNDSGDSGLDGCNQKYGIDFPSGVPARVIVAACEAASGETPHTPTDTPTDVPAGAEVHDGAGEAQEAGKRLLHESHCDGRYSGCCSCTGEAQEGSG